MEANKNRAKMITKIRAEAADKKRELAANKKQKSFYERHKETLNSPLATKFLYFLAAVIFSVVFPAQLNKAESEHKLRVFKTEKKIEHLSHFVRDISATMQIVYDIKMLEMFKKYNHKKRDDDRLVHLRGEYVKLYSFEARCITLRAVFSNKSPEVGENNILSDPPTFSNKSKDDLDKIVESTSDLRTLIYFIELSIIEMTSFSPKKETLPQNRKKLTTLFIFALNLYDKIISTAEQNIAKTVSE